MDTVKRERKVNIDNVSDEQLEVLIQQISDKVVGMVEETCVKANSLLKIYGLQTKMQIVIEPLQQEPQDGTDL